MTCLHFNLKTGVNCTEIAVILYFVQSPELVARLKKLKAEQEKAEYDKMVSNVDKKVNVK